MNKNSTQRFTLKRDQRQSLAQYLNVDTKDDALTCIEEVLHAHHECIRRGIALTPEAVRCKLEAVTRSMRELVRPATIDADTLALIKAPTDALLKVIDDRIKVLSAYRRTHGKELLRFTCGALRVAFEQYGRSPDDRKERRRFVSTVLDCAGIEHPDPIKDPGRLDDLVDTPVDDLDTVQHHTAAQQTFRT